jgi:hypothetical protein
MRVARLQLVLEYRQFVLQFGKFGAEEFGEQLGLTHVAATVSL